VRNACDLIQKPFDFFTVTNRLQYSPEQPFAAVITGYYYQFVRDRIPVGARFSTRVHTGPGSLPSLLYNGYQVFPGSKTARAWRWPPTPI